MQHRLVTGTMAGVVTVFCAATVTPALLSRPATAQGSGAVSNVIPESVAVAVHAKIQTIDPATRTLTLVGRSGTPVTVIAGPNVRLEMLKAGDAVNAKYYRSVAFFVSAPGMAVAEDEVKQVTAQPVEGPGGAGVRVTRISGLVVGIDRAASSIEVVPPDGGAVLTVDVTNPARQASLGMLKVGDTVTAVVSQALAVTIEPAPKSWF